MKTTACELRSDRAPVLGDLDLVQRCLEGCEETISKLKKRLTPSISEVLTSYGASNDEIDKTLAQLWGDCLAGPRPLFQVFNGKSSLQSWLTAISVNDWISEKRHEVQHAPAMECLAHDVRSSPPPGQSGASAPDSSTIDILVPALRRAFAACNVEELMLLRLVHVHGVSQREIASLWKWRQGRVSRHIKRAETKIAELALQAVKETDPYLKLRWDDFIELCRSVEIRRAVGWGS